MVKQIKIKEILRWFHFINLQWLLKVKTEKEYENNLQKDINKACKIIKGYTK